jgi:hypothetical protein
MTPLLSDQEWASGLTNTIMFLLEVDFFVLL